MHGIMSCEAFRDTLNKLTCIIAGAFCFIILISSAWLTFKNFLPVPFWDHWQEITEFSRFQAGQWGLMDWFSQHNEHRILVARLLMFADLKWTKGSGLLNIGAIWVFQAASALLLWNIISPSKHRSRALNSSLFFICLSSMFSLLQDENLQWQFQTQFAGVYTFAIAAVASLTQGCSDDRNHIDGALTGIKTNRSNLAILFGTTASFCMANGLLIWPILIMISALNNHRKTTLHLLVAGFITWCFYLYQYRTPPYHSNPAESLLQLRSLAFYILNYLSIPLKVFSGPLPLILTICGLVVVASMTATLLIKKKKPPTQLLAILSISYFIVGTAAMTGLGRLKFGPDQAFSSRYATPALIFWICVLGLITFISHNYNRKKSPPNIPTVALVLFALILTINQKAKVHMEHNQYPGGVWLRALPYAWSALTSSAPDKQALSGVFMDQGYVLEASVVLKSLSYYPFRGTAWTSMGKPLDDFYRKSDVSMCKGKVETSHTSNQSEGILMVSGWAWDSLKGTQPHLIVITDNNDIIHGLGLPGAYRDDNPTKISSANDRFTGWHGYTNKLVFPMRAYAIIDKKRKACKIGELNTNKYGQ